MVQFKLSVRFLKKSFSQQSAPSSTSIHDLLPEGANSRQRDRETDRQSRKVTDGDVEKREAADGGEMRRSELLGREGKGSRRDGREGRD